MRDSSAGMISRRAQPAVPWIVILGLAVLLGRLLAIRPLVGLAALAIAVASLIIVHGEVKVLVFLTSAALVVGSSSLPMGYSAPVFVVKFALMAAVGATVLAPHFHDSARTYVHTGFALCFLLLVALALASAAYSVDPSVSFEHAVSLFLLWLATAIAVPSRLQESEDFIDLLQRIGLLGMFTVLAGGVLNIGGLVEGFNAGRFMGVLINPNTLGYFLAPILPTLVLMVTWTERGRRRALLVAVVSLLAAGLLLSGSRGGLLSVVVGTSLGLAALRQVRGAFFVLALLGAVAAGILIGFDRPVRTSGEGVLEAGTGSGRIEAWADGLDLIGRRPLTGYGFATTPVLFSEISSRQTTGTPVLGRLHNSYLEAALDLGWAGAVLLLLLGLWGMRAAWRMSRSTGRWRVVGATLLAGITGGVVEGMFETGLLAAGGLLAFHFWLLVGTAHALARRFDLEQGGASPA